MFEITKNSTLSPFTFRGKIIVKDLEDKIKETIARVIHIL